MPMTLDKAIEITIDLTHYVYTGNPQDELDALNLLIEAGKRIQSYRQDPIHVANLPLPREKE